MTIHLGLLVAAFVCFAVSAVGGSIPRVNLVAAGLAFWVFSVLWK